MDTVIRTVDLHKHFGRVQALDGLSLEVARGEIHGFLGPNGAGKSTTLRILLGLARATSGTATVLGRDPWADAVELHRHVASIPGDVSIWPNLSGGEAIDLISRLRGGPRSRGDEARYRARRKELCDTFDFDPTKKGRAYSKGNRQKVALIAALATEAELYLFDEPTSGLDPLMEAAFTREVHVLAERGATVLLSSHILSEVERLADRVSIIRAGKIVDGGTLAALRHLTRTEISFSAGAPGSAGHIDTAALGTRPEVHNLTVADGRVKFGADSDHVAGILPLLGSMDVQGLLVSPPSLEELFLRHYGDTVDSAAPQPEKRDDDRPSRRHRSTTSTGA